MPTVTLPDKPSLEQLRNEARDLQRAVRAGTTAARDTVARLHPDGLPADPSTFPLHAAQLVVARGYGLASWPRLRQHLDTIAAYTRDPEPNLDSEGVADRFCRLACLNYQEDEPVRWAQARRLRAEHPGLSGTNIWTAATAADAASVTRLLAGDSSLARAVGGPYAWEPLMYLAYSRLDPDVAAGAVLACAQALLAAGADPNTGYLWHGLVTPFTALTGAFGEGEQGAGRCPRHPLSLPLARLLLAAGADANDGQTLYNRMFRPDNDHLALLFEFGLGTGDGGAWRARLGGALESSAEMLQRQRTWAVEHGFTDRLRLLARHGVDLRAPLPDGATPIERAAVRGDREMVAFLAATGAPTPELTGIDAFVADCLAGDRVGVDRRLAAEPDLLNTARTSWPGLVCHAVMAGVTGGLDLILELGFDINHRERGSTALHQAAWSGDADLAARLLAAGADPQAHDAAFDATPLGWAQHAHQPDTVTLLAPLTRASD